MNSHPYKSGHAATARRSMGADSRTLSQRAHPGFPSWTEARPHPGGLGSGALDSEYRRTVVSAPPVLSELQHRPSAISTVVSAGGTAGGPHAVGQYAAGRRND